MQVADKVALVTGSSSGIGRAVAIGLAREGAHVVVTGRDKARLLQTAREVEALGRQCLPVEADVTRSKDVEHLVSKTIERFGRIDILVNCAGINPRTSVLDMAEEEWDRVLDTNLKGVFLCSKAVAKHMVAQKGGRIVNITSGRGVGGMVRGAHYSASKAGINGFTISLAMELVPYGINVNAIAPGIMDTPLLRATNTEEQIRELAQREPGGRLGQPEDVVPVVLFLATDASRYMTGQVIYMKTP
ncbi:MAG: SDR family oxidoreductase [Chloroflexi bacterium]|nr:SDR family oxidoreductase [Chloroflexota bacterium]